MHAEAGVVEKSVRKHSSGGVGRFNRLQLIGIGLAVLAIAAALIFLPVTAWLRTAVIWTSDLGWVGMVMFIGLYTIAATLAIPVTPLNIGAGVLFGWWLGFLLAMAGGIGAAMLSFVLARFLLQDWVRRHLARYSTPSAILEDIHDRPWSALITLRLHPFIPATVKNYCVGISDVPIGTNLMATAVAYAPVYFLHSYLGAAGYTSIGHEESWGTLEYVLYGLALAGVLALAVLLTRYAKQRIDAVTQRMQQTTSQ